MPHPPGYPHPVQYQDIRSQRHLYRNMSSGRSEEAGQSRQRRSKGMKIEGGEGIQGY